MEWSGRQRFILELAPSAEPIAGSLTDERGTTVSFTGWLELASALERVSQCSPERARDPAEGTG
ncbi:MAG TPA: hypothetical protein VGI55_12080 [Solirubrobacteraceae bacterium]|jgi:hypothetical protein